MQKQIGQQGTNDPTLRSPSFPCNQPPILFLYWRFQSALDIENDPLFRSKVLARPFPSVLTTMAFDHRRRRRFGTCPCRPVKQLRTTQPFSLSRSWRTFARHPGVIDHFAHAKLSVRISTGMRQFLTSSPADRRRNAIYRAQESRLPCELVGPISEISAGRC